MRAIITGANAGIGKESAVQLAKSGYEVILACRNPECAELARREVIERSCRGRIVNVSSKGLLLYPFQRLDLEDPGLTRRKFSMQRSYYHAGSR